MTRKNYCLPGETYVKGYKRKDGVSVEGYCRLAYIKDPVMDTLGFNDSKREKLSPEYREYLKKQREKYLQEPKKFMSDREKQVRQEEEYNMKMENE